MKNNLTTIRLLKFARRIGSSYLKNSLFKNEQEFIAESYKSEIKFLFWAIRGLPLMFPRYWAFADDESPYLISHPQSHPLVGAGIFFKLSMQEVAQLFIVDKQDLLCGRRLKENATPNDLIENVYELILLKENMPGEPTDSKFIAQQNKIIKIKYQPLNLTTHAA